MLGEMGGSFHHAKTISVAAIFRKVDEEFGDLINPKLQGIVGLYELPHFLMWNSPHFNHHYILDTSTYIGDDHQGSPG